MLSRAIIAIRGVVEIAITEIIIARIVIIIVVIVINVVIVIIILFISLPGNGVHGQRGSPYPKRVSGDLKGRLLSFSNVWPQ